MKAIRRFHQRRRRAGITLIELLIAMLIMVVLTGAMTYTFAASLSMEQRHARLREERNKTAAVEDRITLLLRAIKLSEDATDTHTFFRGLDANSQAATPGSTTTSGSQGSTGGLQQGASSSASELGCDRLTFTTTGLGLPDAARYSSDDFETQNTARGPLGGIAEVSLSTTPIGTPTGAQTTGLFERLQQPSDGDSTQGGTETLLLPGVTQVGFQFWDGQEWVTTWDTVATTHRLPSAVKVSYVMDSDSDGVVHSFTVPILTSDVDSLNPVAGVGAPTTGG